MTVMTLTHKELVPHLEPIPLGKLGLGTKQRDLCEGRVLVTAAQKLKEGMHYYVNVYSYTAAHPDKQRRLL